MLAFARQVGAAFLGALLALFFAYAYFMSPLPLPTFGWLLK